MVVGRPGPENVSDSFLERSVISGRGPVASEPRPPELVTVAEWSLTPPGEVHEIDSEPGTAYDRFRPGIDFAETAQELAIEARNHFERTGERMFVTRRTVLGRMHQKKQTAWRARKKPWSLDDDWAPEIKGAAWEPGDIF